VAVVLVGPYEILKMTLNARESPVTLRVRTLTARRQAGFTDVVSLLAASR
jgi:hypothetical protein